MIGRLLEREGIEPERPPSNEVLAKDPDFIMPKIVTTDIEVETHGQYKTASGKPRGLIVHTTFGRFADKREDALNTLRFLASRGLGCMVMDTDGVIYKAKNQGDKDVAYHAGRSQWMSVSGMSYYCMGMEICNAGKLDDDNTSWFGQKIDATNTIAYPEKTNNIKAGVYHLITTAQKNALINFVKFQKMTNPEFNINWLAGHDEVSPNRKSDPGGSLGETMLEFRSRFRE